jgi:hypothetical protein
MLPAEATEVAVDHPHTNITATLCAEHCTRYVVPLTRGAYMPGHLLVAGVLCWAPTSNSARSTVLA